MGLARHLIALFVGVSASAVPAPGAGAGLLLPGGVFGVAQAAPLVKTCILRTRRSYVNTQLGALIVQERQRDRAVLTH